MNAQDEDGGSRTVLWILGGLGCLGVLCAGGLGLFVGLPAFMKYQKRSKQTETELVMSQIAEGARRYYEQHDAFPGRGTTLETTDSPPEGGSRYKASPPSSDEEKKLRDTLNWPSSGKTLFFQYTYSVEGEGEEASATIRARADFNPESDEVHTTTQTLSVKQGEVQISPPVTKYEFE